MKILASLALVSWIIWGLWAAFGVGWELFTVFYEKKKGSLPLTRILRDRLMRKNTIIKIGVMAFLAWLFLHFTIPLEW